MTILEKTKDEITQKTFKKFYRNAKMKHFKVETLCVVIFYIFIIIIPVVFLDYKFELYKLPNLIHFIVLCFILIFYYVIYLLLKDSCLGALVYLIYYKCINFLFYHIYTCKGKALKKSDFKKIKLSDKSLLYNIKTDECEGYCYPTCFDILKALKKGKMVFVVIGVHYFHKPLMHVLYVNNGWCFDTNFRMQFEYEKALKGYCACIFKEVDYESIKDLSYKEFKRMHREEIENWCIKNNYFSFRHG